MKDLFGETWTQIGGGMWTGSFGVLALIVAVTTSYN